MHFSLRWTSSNHREAIDGVDIQSVSHTCPSRFALSWPQHQLQLHKQEQVQQSGQLVVKTLSLIFFLPLSCLPSPPLSLPFFSSLPELTAQPSTDGLGSSSHILPSRVYKHRPQESTWRAKNSLGDSQGSSRTTFADSTRSQRSLVWFQNNRRAFLPFFCCCWCCHLPSGIVYRFVTVRKRPETTV